MIFVYLKMVINRNHTKEHYVSNNIILKKDGEVEYVQDFKETGIDDKHLSDGR